MTFPATLDLITLTGTFLDGDGSARAGTVTVNLPTPIRSEGDNIVVPPFELSVELDADGSFSLELPATTDPQWLPNTAEYVVQAVFTDWVKMWWTLPLPYDSVGDTIDLADSGPGNVGTPSLTIRQGVIQPLADGGYKGTWSGGTVYRTGDTVQHGSIVYGALKPSSGVTPGTDITVWKAYPSSGGGGGAVDSVFGRTGDVVAEADDYAVADITGLTAALAAKAPINNPTFTGTVGGVTKAMVGLGNVDNTTDLNKPVSTAQAAADATVASNAAAALAAHASDTTDIHGIPDTSVLVTDDDLTTALAGKQNLDADLTAIAALTPVNDDLMQRKAGAWTNRTPAQVKTDLALTKTDVGLGNVDNTSDANKPISTATQTALDGKSNVGHTHDASAVAAGVLDIARIPTGTTGTTVPFGNDARFTDTRTPTDNTVTTAKIVDANVTLAKLANIAASTILGNNTGGAAAPIALTAAQVKTLLAIAQSDVSGLTAALALLAPLASPALTGTATAVNLTMSGRQLNTPVALTPGTTVSVNAALGNDFTLTAGQDFTLANPTNPVNGQKIMFAIRQDATGSRILTLGSDYRLGTDIASVVLSTAANKTDYIGVRYNGTDSKWDVIAFVKGY